MKKIIRFFMMAIILMLSCATANAQQSIQRQRLSREQLVEVQAKHIAHQLAFSDDITAKFVDTYGKCQKEIWTLAPKNKKKKNHNMTDKEAEGFIKARFDNSEKILNIRKKYYKEYSKFLTQTQIERVYKLERQMMNRMAKRRTAQKPAKMKAKKD